LLVHWTNSQLIQGLVDAATTARLIIAASPCVETLAATVQPLPAQIKSLLDEFEDVLNAEGQIRPSSHASEKAVNNTS